MKYDARHFAFHIAGGVATLTLHRPGRKHPLAFDACAGLRDLLRSFGYRAGGGIVESTSVT
jgi:enoyl-CoA hydratase/carnithine racemase